jgi:hypothetical protein
VSSRQASANLLKDLSSTYLQETVTTSIREPGGLKRQTSTEKNASCISIKELPQSTEVNEAGSKASLQFKQELTKHLCL